MTADDVGVDEVVRHRAKALEQPVLRHLEVVENDGDGDGDGKVVHHPRRGLQTASVVANGRDLAVNKGGNVETYLLNKLLHSFQHL